MATLTIRDIDEQTKQRLRERAARAGRSMQEEVRIILRRAVGGVTGPEFVALMARSFGPEGGIDLALPPRSSTRVPPDFGGPSFDPDQRG